LLSSFGFAVSERRANNGHVAACCFEEKRSWL
jgi:hypothetical protein